MLEKILEKILINNFGRFIQGLDKNNLNINIWQGNVTVKNVSVKPDIFDKLELPIIMLFSHIGKLQVKVPWAAINSKPVEVVIEDIFIILSQLEQKDWKYIDYTNFEKRLNAIENYTKEYLQKIIEKYKDKESKDFLNDKEKANKSNDNGLITRLTEKVIDNLQITLNNIHIRFENSIKKPYAFGFTLDQVLLYTTNDKWEKEFIDRSEIKNKYLPLNKLFSLKSAGLYWESNISNSNYFHGLNRDKIMENMSKIIYRKNPDYKACDPNNKNDDINDKSIAKKDLGNTNVNYIITISAMINLTHNNRKNVSSCELSEYVVKLSLQPIDIKIHKSQLEDLIKLLEYVNNYKNFKRQCMIQAKSKLNKEVDNEELEKFKKEFKELYEKYFNNTHKKDIKTREEKLSIGFNNDSYDIEKFRSLLEILPDIHLINCIKCILKEYIKENKVKEIKEQNQNKSMKKGIMSFFTKAQNLDINQINLEQENELKKLQESLDDLFQEVENDDNIEGQKSGLKSTGQKIEIENILEVNFYLMGGSIHINNQKANGDEEGVELSYTSLIIDYNLTSKSQFLQLIQSEFNLHLKTKYHGHNDYIYYPIIKQGFPNKSKSNLDELKENLSPKSNSHLDEVKEDKMSPKLDINLVEIKEISDHKSSCNNIEEAKDDMQNSVKSNIDELGEKSYCENNNMIKIKFEKNPEGKEEGLYYYIECSAIKILYNPLAVTRLRDFFGIKTEDDLAIQMVDISEAIQDKAKESIKNIINNSIKNYIWVKISSPVLIIPFMQNGDFNSECWVANLGDLEVITNVMDSTPTKLTTINQDKSDADHNANSDNHDKNHDNKCEKDDDESYMYEWYRLCLKNINMKYYPTYILYLKLNEDNTTNISTNNSSRQANIDLILNPLQSPLSTLTPTTPILFNRKNSNSVDKILTLIDDFCIEGDMKFKNKYYKTIKSALNKPDTLINCCIKDINIKLNQNIYNHLLKTNHYITKAQDYLSIEIMETQKNRLLQSSLKIGMLYLREKQSREYIWNRYHVVFSGTYLHFFQHIEDNQAKFAIYIKQAIIHEGQMINRKYTFSLENRYNKAFLACDDKTNQEDWIQLIESRVKQLIIIKEPNLLYDAKVEMNNSEDEETEGETPQKEDYMNAKLPDEEAKNNIERPNESLNNLKEETINDFDSRFYYPSSIIKFSMNNLKLDLLENDNSPCMELVSSDFSSCIQTYNAKTVIDIRLHSLEIDDKTYKYHNPNLQTFLTSSPKLPNGANRNGSDNDTLPTYKKDLVDLKIVSLEKEHPNWEKSKTSVDIYLKSGYLGINYKPQLIAWIIVFFVPNREKLENVIGEDSVLEMKLQREELGNLTVMKRMRKEIPTEEEKLQVEPLADIKVTFVNLQIDADEFNIDLVHKLTRVCVFGIRFTQASIWVTVSPETIKVRGTLGNFQLIDMSGYPFTEDSNLNYELITPYEIIGLGDKAKNLAEFVFINHDPEYDFPEKKDRTFNELTLNLYNIRVNYIQQVTERFISYLDEQILFLTDIELNLSGASFKPIKLTEKFARFLLEYPSFFQLNTYIENPILTLKPLPKSEDYIELTLKEAIVSSSRIKNITAYSNPSSKLDFVYRDLYTIKIENMRINKVITNIKSKISNIFNVIIEFERPLLYDVYNYLYNKHGKFKLSKAFEIRGKFDPIILILTRLDYLLIMRSIFRSILYDDMMDMLYTYNFDKKITNTPVILDASLQFENLNLLILDSLHEHIPFAVISFHLPKIDFHRQVTKRILFEIISKIINISYFYKATDSDKIIEKKLLGPLEEIHEYDINDYDKLIQNIIDNIKLKTDNIKKKYEISTKEGDEEYTKETSLNIFVENLPTKDKLLRIALRNMHVYFMYGTYLKLLDFILFDSTVDAPLPKYWQKMKAKYQDHYKNVGKAMGSLVVSLNLIDSVVTVPFSHSFNNLHPEVLTARCDLFLGFERYHALTLQNILTEIAETSGDPNIYQVPCLQNMSSALKLSVTNCEVFHCELPDLIKHKSFNQVKKRNIVLPFSFHFNRKWHLVLDENCTRLVECIRNDINFEKVIIRSCLNDYVLLLETIKFQISLFRKHQEENKRIGSSLAGNTFNTFRETFETLKPEIILDNSNTGVVAQTNQPLNNNNANTVPNQEIKPIQEESYQFTRMILKSSQNKNQKNGDEIYEKLTFYKEELAIQSNGFQICLLNELFESLIPIMELTIYNVDIRAFLYGVETNISANTVLSMLFFNYELFKWEPILEKFGINIHFINSKNLPKLQVAISNMLDYPSLNINLSDQMIETFLKLQNMWNQTKFRKSMIMSTSIMVKSDPKNHLTNSNNHNLEDIVEYISPYSIVNETGYAIEIERDNSADNNISNNSNKYNRVNTIFKVENNNKINYLIKSDMNKLFKQNTSNYIINSNKVKMKIMHPFYNINTMNNIELDKTTIIPRLINGLTSEGKNLGLLNHYIYCDTIIKNGKKILTIASSVRIKNETGRILYFNVMNGDKYYEEILENNQTKAVPFDLINSTINFTTIKNNIRLKTKNYLQNYLTENGGLYEIKSSNEYFILRVTRIHKQYKLYTLTLEPPFSIENCCHMPLLFEFSTSPNDNAKNSSIFELKPKECKLETKMSRSNPLYLRGMTNGYDWSDIVRLYSPSSAAKPSTSSSSNKQNLIMKDINGNALRIIVQTKVNDQGYKKYYVYAKICAINETPYDLIYYIADDSFKEARASGQSFNSKNKTLDGKVIMMNEYKKLKICVKEEENNKKFSEDITIGGVGNHAVEVEVPSKKACYELGINISLHTCEESIPLYTKIITVSPRYVIINKSKASNIWVKGDSIDELPQEICADSRKPLIWQNWSPKKLKSICIKSIETNKSVIDPSYWSWSGPIDLTAVGTHNIMLLNAKKNESKFLKITSTNEKSLMYILIEDVPSEFAAYKIYNNTNKFDLKLYQSQQNPNDGIIISSNGGSIPFGWVYPCEEKSIYIDFLNKESSSIYHDIQNKFLLDEINKTLKIKIPVTDKKYVYLTAVIKFEGSTKVLIISDYNNNELRAVTTNVDIPKLSVIDQISNTSSNNNIDNIENKPLEDQLIRHIAISVESCNISLIVLIQRRNNPLRCEALHAYIKGTEFAMVQYFKTKSSQLRIKYINIDNNTSNITPFPVFLTSTKPEISLMQAKEYFLDICITQIPDIPTVAYFKSVNIFLTPIALKIDSQLVEILLEMREAFLQIKSKNTSLNNKTISEILFDANSKDGLHMLLKKENLNPYFSWVNSPITSSEYNVFIQELIIPPLFIDFSFQKIITPNEKDEGLMTLLSNGLGVTFANVDGVNLNMNGIMLNNTFDSKSGIINKLVRKYKDESAQIIFKLVSSIDILGNPLGLFSNITTGVKDLFEKPINGFVQGPLEGSKGLAEGAVSLVKNTISGTFNSINKVTGSLASGITTLTMDEDFIIERERAKNKRANHVGEGLVQGMTSLATGVGSGIVGLVEKPIQGASKGGVLGFFKGTFQGVAGLVVKPVAGILDATSKTAEGIKNTATFNDEKPNEIKSRYPRAFYGKEKNYRAYYETDAEIMNILNSYENGLYANISLIHAFDMCSYELDSKSNNILVISHEYILYWCVKESIMEWEIEPINLYTVKEDKDGLTILLKKPTQKIQVNYIIYL